jgi:hypothetical protein
LTDLSPELPHSDYLKQPPPLRLMWPSAALVLVKTVNNCSSASQDPSSLKASLLTSSTRGDLPFALFTRTSHRSRSKESLQTKQKRVGRKKRTLQNYNSGPDASANPCQTPANPVARNGVNFTVSMVFRRQTRSSTGLGVLSKVHHNASRALFLICRRSQQTDTLKHRLGGPLEGSP